QIAPTNKRTEEELAREYTAVPSSIFIDRDLAPLESITEYLKEKHGLSFHEIALLLNRDDRTVWTCYNRASKKLVPN
ncbi:hypothetical protein KY363_07350, partial [Candidatus Woesearchaeota archaeon]|nr:hypothetical protein [Candidatus Woesearchaeota archaeon]